MAMAATAMFTSACVREWVAWIVAAPAVTVRRAWDIMDWCHVGADLDEICQIVAACDAALDENNDSVFDDGDGDDALSESKKTK